MCQLRKTRWNFWTACSCLRRGSPPETREDVLTSLAEAKYPDGSTPEVLEVVGLATFLFGAGQETTTELLTNPHRHAHAVQRSCHRNTASRLMIQRKPAISHRQQIVGSRSSSG